MKLVPKMRAYALVLTKSASDADDLVQDALVRARRFQAGFANAFLTKLHASKHTVEHVGGKFAAQLVSNPDQEFNLRYRELLVALKQLSPETREACY